VSGRDRLRLIFGFTIALVCMIQGCATSQPRLPSVTEAPTGYRETGKIIWHDLITHTPEASKRFYQELFGWEFEDLGLDFGFGRTVNYTLIRNRGELVGGMVDANLLGRPDPEQLSQWVVAMSVDDLDAAVATAMEGGGKVLTPPTDVAERGRIALIEDDQGAALALLQTRDGDPVDGDFRLGGFLWDEVWTGNIESAIAFYSRLAKLEVSTFALANGTSYRYMASAGSARFGFLQTPIEDLSPTWTSYLRVEEPADIVARVVGLGGRVLVPLRSRGEGEQAALLAGPSGAGIAIQTWSDRTGIHRQQPDSTK
jgi:predicted enzyme related to lactoylglutathione lyase